MTKQITLTLALVFAMFTYGQKMKVQKGDFSFIKGQKEINVEFVYDNLTINKDKLTELAEVLLEKEVIFKDNLEKIFGKRAFEKDLQRDIEEAKIIEDKKLLEEAKVSEDAKTSEEKE